jgi:hypothetical protein
MSGGAPDMNCSLSGAPVWARLTSARAARAFNASQVAVGAEIVVAPLLHRTVRWIIAETPFWFPEAGEFLRQLFRWAPDTVRCAPDSPVNYSASASGNSRRWRVRVGVLWCTGQSGAPDQRCLRLSLFSLVESNIWSFYWLSVNLFHLYNLYTRAN